MLILMNGNVCKEITIEELLKLKHIPHFKNLINLFPHLLTVNVSISNSVPLFKKSKKNESYIRDLNVFNRGYKPNHYDMEQYEVETVQFESEICLFDKTNYEFKNIYTNDFNLVINNIPTLRLHNKDEFNKTIQYYRDLYSKMNIDYELINKINNDKTVYIRTDEHDKKHSNPNNVFDVSKFDNTLVITNNDVNLELFNHFYDNYMVFYKIVKHINLFLMDCKNNNIIPYFLNEPTPEHIFDIKNIYYTRYNVYGIKILNYNNTLCIKQDNILKQPTHIELMLNKKDKEALYRLQCVNDKHYDNLDTYNHVHQSKLSILLKKYIDDTKSKNKIKQMKNTNKDKNPTV